MWVRDLLKARSDGSNYNLVKEMAMGDIEMYFRYMRMTPGRMEHLFNLVAPSITKLSTNYRQPIPSQQRLSLTLRHLATGIAYFSQFAIPNWTPNCVKDYPRNMHSYLRCSHPYLRKHADIFR